MTRQLDSFEVGPSRVGFSIEGDGPLIVFSYALGDIAWGPLDKLKRDATVVVLNWLESEVPPPMQMSYSWFPALLKSVGFDKAALASWSMGAPAIITYAATNPRELSGLVLVDPAGFVGRPKVKLRDVPFVLTTLRTGKPTRGFVRPMWRSWIRNPRVDRRPLEEAHLRFLQSGRGKITGRSDSASSGSFLDTLKTLRRPGGGPATGMEQELLPALEKITVPTLVLTGQHSTVLGPGIAPSIMSRLSKGTLVIFEDSAHGVQLEEPERFQEVVAEFLRSSET